MQSRGIPDSHEAGADVQFYERLAAIDEALSEAVRRKGCRHCGGPLHRADYARKPRGGGVAPAVEAWSKRFSLCCARDGCRRRSTPPSVRFLGRRVYAEVVVLVACMRSLARPADTQIPRRTVGRWLSWWRTTFVASALWLELRGRFVPAPDEVRLPTSLLEQLEASAPLLHAAYLLAPCTTSSVPDGSSFVRCVM